MRNGKNGHVGNSQRALFEGQLTVVRSAGSEMRHCVLKKDAFQYYAMDDSTKPLARFPIVSSSSMEWIPSGLKLRHGSRVITLQGSDATVANWGKALQHAFGSSRSAPLHLRIFGFHGQMCEVMAEISWRVRDVKAMINSKCAILPSEQRLVYNTTLLKDSVLLADFLPEAGIYEIFMVRCPPAIELPIGGEVMERQQALIAVQQDWRRLGEMSQQYRCDREIVMAAVAQDCMALQFASDDLRADREVILRAVHQSGSALEFVNEDLREEVLSCAIGY